jgi:protein-tyrosine-phosphatase
VDLELQSRRHAALGDPVRLAIVEFVRDSDRTVNAIQEFVEVSSSLLAHHLDVLEEVGLITRRQSDADGRKRFVSLQLGSLPRLSFGPIPARLVFVCTENSARSQFASALWSKITGIRASSAGTKPAKSVHPLAVEVGKRRGLDLSAARPRALDQSASHGSMLVTVCDAAFEELGSNRIDAHWSIADPAKRGTRRAFLDALDAIEERINNMKGTYK